MSSEAPAPPAAPTATRDGNARPSPAWRRRALLTLVIVTLLAISGGWFAYAYLSGTEAAPDSEDKLALSIIGGWWNIAGDRHLMREVAQSHVSSSVKAAKGWPFTGRSGP